MTSGLGDVTACPFSLPYDIPSSPSPADSGRVAGHSGVGRSGITFTANGLC